MSLILSPERNFMNSGIWFILVLLSIIDLKVEAQGTAFTYQGRLAASAAPVSGSYDIRFRLATDPLGNDYVTNTILSNGVSVADGFFTMKLDFGSGVFNGSNYWLEVAVKTNGAGAYTVLN